MTTSNALRRPACLVVLCTALAAGCSGAPGQKIVTIRARAVGYEKSAVMVGRGIPMGDGKGTMQILTNHDVTTFEVISPERWAGRQFGLYHEQPPEKDSFWRAKGWTFSFTAEEDFVFLLVLGSSHAAKYMNVKPEPPSGGCVSVKAEFIETDAEFLDEIDCNLENIPEPQANQKK